MTTGGPAGHLSDEQLSDLLDGLADAEQAAHADSCAGCAGRLAAWRHASQSVAAPVSVSDVLREAAVQAALGLDHRPSDASDNLISLPSRIRRRPSGSLIQRLAAVAAAILVIAGVSVAVTRGDRGHVNTRSSTALGTVPTPSFGSAAGSSAGSSAGSESSRSSASGNTVASSLGRFTDMAAVVTAIHQRQASAPQAPVASAGGSTATAGTAASGTGASSPNAASPSSLTAPAADVPAAASSCTGRALADAAPFARAAPSLMFAATLTYRGVPAAVYLFAGSPAQVIVVELGDGCALLGRSTD